MKKMMMIAAAAAMTFSAMADRTPAEIVEACAATNQAGWAAIGGTMTTSEWRAYFDYVISVASTNENARHSMAYRPLDCVNALCRRANAIGLRGEYDHKFAVVGVAASVPWDCTGLPEMREVWIADPTNAVKVSKLGKTIEYIRRKSLLNYWVSEVSAPEFANLMMEHRMWGGSLTEHDAIVRRAMKDLKRRIRSKGMPIVAKDGSNPVQDEIDALTAALNAPRYAGVKEWFAKWYPEYEWIDAVWETDEEIAELKDKVYNGDIEFSTSVQDKLRANLGVAEYNKFVQEYNK